MTRDETRGVRPPGPGEVQVVLLLDDATYVSWAMRDALDGIMDALERRLGLGADARTSAITQMRVRLWAVETLRKDARVGAAWGDVVAAGCVWLALRHHSGSDEVRRGLDLQLATSGAVLTASVGESSGAQPGTAWAFMVGDRIHDGRPQLAVAPHSQVVTMREGLVVDVRPTVIPPHAPETGESPDPTGPKP